MHTTLRTAIIAIALAFGAFDSFAGMKLPDPLIGHWRWRNEIDIVDIRPDGSAQSRYGVGVWKPAPKKTTERKYTISWYGGETVDQLTLSEDGQKLAVKTNKGITFTAEKVTKITSR